MKMNLKGKMLNWMRSSKNLNKLLKDLTWRKYKNPCKSYNRNLK